MTDPLLTIPRVTRPIRNINLNAIGVIAGDEDLARAEMVRLLLSYATWTWRPGRRGICGEDEYSVKLLPAGIDAVKTLADREGVTWDTMAAQLLAFAVETWTPGWRKDQPSRRSPNGLAKAA